MREFSVVGCGLFVPGFSSVEAWRNGDYKEEDLRPSGSSLERRSRRLASDLMRGLAGAYQEAVTQGELAPESVASVFGSAISEAKTMIGLLDQMWALNEEPSPMAFAASVHNAAAGVVSISNKNREFTTSIAADFDTVAMSLMEAVGLLVTGTEAVVIACGDEAAPEKLVTNEFHWSALCASVALHADPHHPRALARIRVPQLGVAGTIAAPKADAALQMNPQFGLLRLIDAVCGQQSGVVPLDEGLGRGWSVEVLTP